MKIYKVSQDINNGYGTYDSFIIIAKNLKDVITTHPDGSKIKDDTSDWVDNPKYVKVEYLGTAKKSSKKGVVCASFNAG